MSEEASVTTTAEEPVYHPPRLWGIDLHFSAFSKLYIGDILNMKPYSTHPGAFAYGNHPIFRVDVLGIIVRKDSKPKLYLYSVDDGTGVINCCVWKQHMNSKEPQHGNACTSQFPVELQSMLVVLEQERDTEVPGYELGDLVHIRGKLKLFRDMMEIVAMYHNKIDDPNRQSHRMIELPDLYRRCYDRPFVLPPKVQEELSPTENGKEIPPDQLKEQLMDKIHELLTRRKLEEFSLSDLMQDSNLIDLAGQLATDGDDTEALRQTLKWMEERKGTVCCRLHVSPAYENLDGGNCALQRQVLELVIEECSKPHYAEKGCHYVRLHDKLLRTVHYSTLKRTALLHVLGRLETTSDVIRSADGYYMPV